MKIHGLATLPEYARTISLPRPDGTALAVTLRPLPLGFHQRLRAQGLAAPPPPTRIARDAGGKPLRDESGLVVMLADERDAQHLIACEVYHQRVAVLAFAESVAGDTSITFETPAPADGDWCAYADALFEELRCAGFSDGDLIRLCHEVCRLSNLVDDHVRQAQGDFSSPPLPDTT